MEGSIMRARDFEVEKTQPGKVSPRPVPPLIALWKAEERSASQGWFTRWRKSEVASYRLELVLSYLAMMLVGGTSIAAGIPVFDFTAPEGWVPIWGAVVIAAGLTAAVGALRAGETPQNRTVRNFNRVEVVGAMALFVTLGVYAAILIVLGNGGMAAQRVEALDPATMEQNLGRIATGSVLIALGIRPAVRMVWLIFRPGKVHESTKRGQ